MNTDSREQRIIETFATLADTLVDSYDVVDLLQTLVDTCIDVLDIEAAGIMLANARGELEVIASTSEASRLIEILQLDADAGPCMSSFASGQPVFLPDVAEAPAEWREFRDEARAVGFNAVHAFPLRLRESVIGTLNLFGATSGDLQLAHRRVAQTLADVATIGILHARTLRESDRVQAQLQETLQARATVEQAKGVVSHTRSIPIDEAFVVILGYARNNGVPLAQVAKQIVRRELHI